MSSARFLGQQADNKNQILYPLVVAQQLQAPSLIEGSLQDIQTCHPL